DGEDQARLFMLDPEKGTLTFGDGNNGAVPPIGSAILAQSYDRVVGAAANAVKAGDELPMITAIAGVEKVIALAAAHGGIDVESVAEARSRAPAKTRNQDSVVSLADLEDFVARMDGVAQARASNWRGGVRVVVVASPTDPVPPPSLLQAVADAVG